MSELFELAEMADTMLERECGVFEFRGVEFELREGSTIRCNTYPREMSDVRKVMDIVEFIAQTFNHSNIW